MVINTLEKNTQLVLFEKIYLKDSEQINFKDIISLIFYATANLASDKTKSDYLEWYKIYTEYENDLEMQNQKGWPNITINRNDYAKRMDVVVLSKPYIKSNNLLTMLMRLLHIENYKRPYVYSKYKYYKVFSHKIYGLINKPLNQLSLSELYHILSMYLKYYIMIYNNKEHIEHQIANGLLERINF